MSTSDLWSTPTVGGECQDFTRWWNSEGQFLQPIGDMQTEYGLDFAKKIAESVYADLHQLVLETQKERDSLQEELDAYSDEDDSLKKATELITNIADIVDITLSSKDKSIKTLIKKYRENNED